MTGIMMKIIICPLVVGLSAFIFPNVSYSQFYQPIIVGVILAVAGHLMELILLREETIIINDVVDFIASVIIVYFVSNLFLGAAVTFFGAILTAIFLTITEIPTHRWLVRSGRAEKTST